MMYVFLTLLVLSLLAAGGVAWWLWGWRAGGLSFHSCWNEQQQAEMRALADDLRGFQRGIIDSRILHAYDGMYDVYLKKNDDGAFVWVSDTFNRWEEEWTAAVGAKRLAAPILRSLKRMAAEGQDAVSPQEAGLVAQAAIRTLRPQLAAEFIRRGADVNAKHVFKDQFGETEGESTFECTLVGNAYFSKACIPLAERLALLELMLKHGAKISSSKNTPLILAFISAFSEVAPDHGAVLEWLLDHGYTIQSAHDVEIAAMSLSCRGTLPAFKRIVQKGQFPLSPENKARLLRRIISSPNAESEEKARWALDELGADPNTAIFSTQESEDNEGDPIMIQMQDSPIIESITRYLPIYESEEKCSYGLRLLELLLNHGASLPENAADRAPQFPALRDRYMEIISKFSPGES